jgi:hypothetical protein
MPRSRQATEHSEEQLPATFLFFKTKQTKPPSHNKIPVPGSPSASSSPDLKVQVAQVI